MIISLMKNKDKEKISKTARGGEKITHRRKKDIIIDTSDIMQFLRQRKIFKEKKSENKNLSFQNSIASETVFQK